MRTLSRALFLSGLVAIVTSLGGLHASQNNYSFTGTFRFPWLVAFLLITALLAYGLAVPDRGGVAQGARRALIAMLGSIGAISAAQLVLGTSLLPRSVLLGASLMVPALGAITSAVASAGQRQQAARDRVLAIVSIPEAHRLRGDLEAGLERELTLVRTVAAQEVGAGLDSLVSETRASILVLGKDAAEDGDIIDQAAALHATGLRIRPLLAFYEEWVGKLPVSELRRSALLFDISDVHGTLYQRSSRALDITVAILALPVLLVGLPFVVVGNLLGNRGPLFFRQSRVGRDGSHFDILKLRTMTPGTSSSEWTAEGDARITSFGQVLRGSHIDELPQLINILQGELSIVGPRPEQPHYVEKLRESIPFYELRHVVQPGLTGWAQVNYRYGNTEFDALEKLQFEFYYLRHQSLWLDLRIMARTLQSVIGRRGH